MIGFGIISCSPKSKDTEGKEVLVLAAASLTDVLTELATTYKEATGVTVTFSFASSGALQTQIESGSPADIFFSAAQKQMNALEEKSLIDSDTRKNLLENKVVLITPANSTLNIKGKFDKYNSDLYNLNEKDAEILFDEAIIIFGIGNKKNLLKLPKIIINENEELKYYEKTVKINLPMFSNIFLFNISKEKLFNGFEFETSIDIQGGNSLIINPMASDNYFNISSKWSDPSFTGGFLPTKRELSKNGFNAEWNIASFNASYNKYWTSEEENKNNEYKFEDNQNVIISFLLLNDNYQKILRSVKYSILFIFIPFFVLFLCEVISKKRIHPVQYILIGISNAIFYLLLLAISEHINFNLSYLISAIMVVLLTSMYIGYIIKSKKYILSMAIVEILIYIFLFGILQLTDYALLMGTLGLFIVIAAGMYFSRNVDWYGENNS